MNNLTSKKPSFLAKKAEKFYFVLLGHLQQSAGSSEIDIYQLGVLSNAFADYEQAAKTLQSEGSYYDTPAGLKRLHPALTVQNEALKIIHQLSAVFGLNPKSRKLLMESWQSNEEPDELDLLLAKYDKD